MQIGFETEDNLICIRIQQKPLWNTEHSSPTAMEGLDSFQYLLQDVFKELKACRIFTCTKRYYWFPSTVYKCHRIIILQNVLFHFESIRHRRE